MKVIVKSNNKDVEFEYCCRNMKHSNEIGNIVYNSVFNGVYAHFQLMDLRITNCPWCGEEIRIIKKRSLSDVTIGELFKKKSMRKK